MRKGIATIILVGLMMPTVVFGQHIKLVVNNQEVKTGVAPFKKEGTTMVPLKVIADELDAKVEFDSKNQKVIVAKDNKLIVLPINQKMATVDGKQYDLPVAAQIINGTTMVPVKFVAEHLDCTTGWDYKSNTVLIATKNVVDNNKRSDKDIEKEQNIVGISEIQPPKEYMDEAVKELAKKISFTTDIEVFTLYAFMNYTGYTDENNKAGFSPVRKAVLEDLNAMNLDLKDNEYYKNKEIKYSDYRKALLYMSKAPNFEYGKSLPNYLKELKDLPEHLEEFYKEANIEGLYKKYEKEYQQEQDKYKELVCPAIAKMNYYLNVDNREVESFAININLLDAYWRGSGLGSGEYYYNKKTMILTGPSDEPNISNIVHEYLHGIITPITNKLEKEIGKLSYLRKDVPLNSQADGYGDWRSIVGESIIRGIAGKAINDDAKDIAQSGYDEGFILSLYFYERFDEFETYDGSLEDFIKKLIIEYK